MSGNVERGRMLKAMWLKHSDNLSFGFYTIGMQAALADSDIARRTLDDLTAAFGNTFIQTQTKMDESMATIRDWYKKQDALLQEDNPTL